MFIKNNTAKPIVLVMRLEGYDARIEVVEPGKISKQWLNLEDDEILMIGE